MSASDHLGPQFFHSTEAELSPGDYIQPGFKKIGGFSADFPELGHKNFVHMETEIPNSMYGRHTYEVEPEGLTNKYDWKKAVGSKIEHSHWISLAPVRVKRRLDPSEVRDRLTDAYGARSLGARARFK